MTLNPSATHSVPVFEHKESRRHSRQTVEELRAAARAAPGPATGGVERFVQFAGVPRSGHSLLGAILDAHPQAVVSHELDAMGLVAAGFDRAEIFALIARNAAEFAAHGRYWNGFCYAVPGAAPSAPQEQEQGQGPGDAGATREKPDRRIAEAAPGLRDGQTDPEIRVMGDKKGDWAVRRIRAEPDLAERLAQCLGGAIAACWISILRNPFDNIATLSLRKGRHYDVLRIAAPDAAAFDTARQAETGGRLPDHVLPEMIEDYADLCAGLAMLKARTPPGGWLELRHEDLVAAPAPGIRRVLDFLGLPDPDGFSDRAARLVAAAPNRTRHQIGWLPGQRARVEGLISQYDFLDGYDFDD
jgi:hypothetical protein